MYKYHPANYDKFLKKQVFSSIYFLTYFRRLFRLKKVKKIIKPMGFKDYFFIGLSRKSDAIFNYQIMNETSLPKIIYKDRNFK